MSKKSGLIVWIIVSSTLVTVAELLLHAYWLKIYDRMGVYIPLIIISCLILRGMIWDGVIWGQAKITNSALMIFESMKLGAAFVLVVGLLSCLRELLGAGSIFGYRVVPLDTPTLRVFLTPAGALILLGLLLAVAGLLAKGKTDNKSEGSEGVR